MSDLEAQALSFALQRDHTAEACLAFARRVWAEALRDARASPALESVVITREEIAETVRDFVRGYDSFVNVHGLADALLARLRPGWERQERWIADLQSEMYVNCVYCGHRYGPGETTPVSMADALKAHVEQCPKHPMSALRADLKACAEALVEAWDDAEELGTRRTEKMLRAFARPGVQAALQASVSPPSP